jgi:Ribosomal L27e protein family
MSPQTFIKVVNYQHMMPTRYTLDVDLKSAVPADVLDQEDKKDEARRVRGPAGVPDHRTYWQHRRIVQFMSQQFLLDLSDVPCFAHLGRVHQLTSHSLVLHRRPRTCCSRSLPRARTGGSSPSCGSEGWTRCGVGSQPRHDGALRTLGLKTQPVGRTASVATFVQRYVRAAGPRWTGRGCINGFIRRTHAIVNQQFRHISSARLIHSPPQPSRADHKLNIGPAASRS